VAPAGVVAAAGRRPALIVVQPRTRRYWRKRLFDFCVGLIAAIVLAPALALIWAAVRATSPGPGLYWSARAGRRGRVFFMPKFRTMGRAAPQTPREQLADADDHVTPIGAILRRWSLDELPQLICILKGDMSFIGPRPLMPNDPAQLERGCFPEALTVRPGLSGLAQIRGRNLVSPRRKARLDAFYARRRTGPFDLEIFARTIGVLVSGRGFI
jgi:O-antigen biosynthesis protein WbqP